MATNQIIFAKLSVLLFFVSSVKTVSLTTTSTSSVVQTEDESQLLKKSEILDMLIYGNTSYDATHLPPRQNKSQPRVVSVGLNLRSLENLDDVGMQYTTQVLFWQEWVDSRLDYRHVKHHKDIDTYMLLPTKTEHEIWTPDLFFNNEKSGHLHELIVPNTFTRLYKNGKVLQSYRISLVLSCDMDLRAYPMDVQDCPLSIETYGWTTDDLVLEWIKDRPVFLSGNFSTSRFRLVEIYNTTCESNLPTGSYSCLTLRIKFAREFGFYLIQIYLPCAMLVIVSWVSFWLEPSAVEARFSLGVTTILAMVTQIYGINQSAPPASYAKALDVWTAWCQVMVFGALLELACVNYICIKQKMKGLKKKLSKESIFQAGGAIDSEEQCMWKAITTAKRIDRASRIIFPAIFITFNVFYWWSSPWRLGA